MSKKMQEEIKSLETRLDKKLKDAQDSQQMYIHDEVKRGLADAVDKVYKMLLDRFMKFD
jgi:vacuolar-type H+-ATPase subunit H